MATSLRERLVAGVCAIGLLTAACSSDGGAVGDPEATPASSSTTPTEGPLADAVFLTAVDEVVAGTVYEGLVDAAPGEFLLTATIVCERLADGQGRSDVLGLYLDALGAGEPTQGDARLAGALVGASIEVYCPDHST